MRATIIGCVFALLLGSVPAGAVTLRDIIDLTKAGLGDDILLALIEVDERVFAVDGDTLKQLKAAGVSERVIVALIRSGRLRPQAADAEPASPPLASAPPAPEVVYLPQPSAPVVYEVLVPVPVYIAVPQAQWRGRRGQSAPHVQAASAPSYPSAPAHPARPQPYLTDIPQPKGEPVYWGSGGKLRPDAWKPKP